LDTVILAFFLPTTLKRYCVQVFAILSGSQNKGLAKKTGFTVPNVSKCLLIKYYMWHVILCC